VKILFLSLTKAQYIYFKNLHKNLNCTSKVIFFPSIFISLNGFKILKNIDTETILELKFREVDIKYRNYLHNVIYKRLLKFQTIWFILYIYRYLKLYNPKFIALWNGKKFHQQLAIEVAKVLDIKPIFFENGVLPNTTTLDFKGVNASNSTPRDIEFFKKLEFKNIKLPNRLEDREPKRELIDSNIELPNRYIFVPFQVAYDTQIIQHSPWIEDMFRLFEIVESISKQIDIPFVIKEHPSDRVSNYKKLYKRANRNIIFSSANTQELIQNAEAIITINSSVAIEALLFYKKVVVLGEAFFAIEPIVKIAESRDRLLEILKDIDNFRVEKGLIDKFLAYLYYEYLIPDSWKNPTHRHFKAIEERVKC